MHIEQQKVKHLMLFIDFSFANFYTCIEMYFNLSSTELNMLKHLLLTLLIMTTVISCTKTHNSQKVIDKYLGHIKKNDLKSAYSLLDDESKNLVPMSDFENTAKSIKSSLLNLKKEKVELTKNKTFATLKTKFTGSMSSRNTPEFQISFYAVKVKQEWKVRLDKLITDIKKKKKADSYEIPLSPELIATGGKYKDLIEVTELKNGEVTYDNDTSQYMMEATIKNNSDKPFSFIGVKVKFMTDDETKVLLEKVFYLIYTRQIQAIYPLKPKQTRNSIIPGYDPADLNGEWTGKLQWEVYTAKIATPGELVTLDD